MRASGDWGGRSGWRSWNSRLWGLAAVLGLATILSSGTILHNSAQHRAVLRLVARITAQQVAERAASRLEALAAQLPGMPRRSNATGVPLAQRFELDVATARLDRTPEQLPHDSALPGPALLAELASSAARRPTAHLVLAPELGEYTLLTLTQPSPRDGALTVYGLVARTREILTALFSPPRTDLADDSAAILARLDTLSLQVATPARRTLFGGLAADRPAVATASLRGPLEGLTLTVALAADQIPRTLLSLTPRMQLWHNGLLLLSTTLVIGLAVRASRRELQLARARSDFIAGVSHDLRMPLAQILIAGETLTLRRERNEADRLSLASSIVREAQRLIGLVDNVLLFSRSGAVAERPRLEPVDTAALLEDVITAVQLSADDARQSVTARSGAAGHVLGDRRLLRQALVNLVDNALKYGAPGQRIELAALPAGPGRVRLQVEDQGPGVPAEQRARVFEPYERLGRDQASERTGSGLGLAVVRHIADSCDGKAWLEEAPGGGTRAILELRSAKAA